MKPQGRGRPRLRSWILVSIAALAIAQWFLFDMYEVRGNSMQPLLIDRNGHSDRVLALAHGYAFSAPRRFDLVVFDRPKSDLPREEIVDVSGDRCVKRVIAFAGEQPYIDDGDLFLEHTEGGVARRERLRRPLDVIEKMIVRVTTLELVPGMNLKWSIPIGSKIDGKTWSAETTEPSGGSVALQYEDPIRNDFVDREGRLVAGSDEVNDVGLEFDFEPTRGATCLVIQLREQADVFSIALSTSSPLCIERRRGPSAGESFKATDPSATLPNRHCHVRALNCDDQILVWIDGHLAAQWSYPGNELAVGIIPNAPSLVLESGAARFSEITVIRDAYYTRTRVAGTGISDFAIVPNGQLFVLGDNSVNSIDSRDFGPIDQGLLAGRPLARYRRGDGFFGL